MPPIAIRLSESVGSETHVIADLRNSVRRTRTDAHSQNRRETIFQNALRLIALHNVHTRYTVTDPPETPPATSDLTFNHAALHWRHATIAFAHVASTAPNGEGLLLGTYGGLRPE